MEPNRGISKAMKYKMKFVFCVNSFVLYDNVSIPERHHKCDLQHWISRYLLDCQYPKEGLTPKTIKAYQI